MTITSAFPVSLRKAILSDHQRVWWDDAGHVQAKSCPSGNVGSTQSCCRPATRGVVSLMSYIYLSEPSDVCIWSRDVGLETWSWSRDRSRPLFWGLGLGLGLGLVLVLASLVLVSVLVSACLVLVLVLVSEGGLEQDLRLCATATLLVSKVETSKWMCSIIYLFIRFSAFSSF